MLTDFPDCASRLLDFSTGFDAATGFFVAGAGFGGGGDLAGAGFAAALTGLGAGFIAALAGGAFFAGTAARVGFAAAFTGAFFAFAATGLLFAGTFALFAFPVGAGLLFAIACVHPMTRRPRVIAQVPPLGNRRNPCADTRLHAFSPRSRARRRAEPQAYFGSSQRNGIVRVSRLVILMLECYKRWLSPLLGSRCRFHPSCSDYARIAVARFGAARGGWLGLCRILRCQPLCAGGADPVPERFTWWPGGPERPQGNR